MRKGLKLMMAAGITAGLAFGLLYNLPSQAQDKANSAALADYETALAACALHIFPIPEPGEKVPADLGLDWDYDTQEFLMTCMAAQGYKPNVPDIDNWDIDDFDVQKAARSPKFKDFDAKAEVNAYIEKVRKQVEAEKAEATASAPGQGGEAPAGKTYRYDPPSGNSGTPKPIFMPR